MNNFDPGTHDKFYTINKQSLHASSNVVWASMTITDFEKDGDSGEPAECDGQYHLNELFLVSLPTKWYLDGQKCFKGIIINFNGKNAIAMVVDECDSNYGCPDDIVAASKAVWQGL